MENTTEKSRKTALWQTRTRPFECRVQKGDDPQAGTICLGNRPTLLV